jgi:hypothetical protein
MTLSNRESYEDYMVRRLKEEEFSRYPTTPELLEKIEILEKRIKTIETDLAYIWKPIIPDEYKKKYWTHTVETSGDIPEYMKQKIKEYLNK